MDQAPRFNGEALDPSAMRVRYAIATFAATGWLFGYLLLASRLHLVHYYQVSPTVDPLWGVLVASNGLLCLGLLLAAALAMACARTGRQPLTWLALAWFVPSLDLCRVMGGHWPESFAEPLGFALLTGVAVSRVEPRHWLPARLEGSVRNTPWAKVIWIVSALIGTWWWWEASSVYNGYLLGFNDFGQFAQRVANTWEGRGFLVESPGLPIFWDHFNPGLIFLVPLWGLWPDARLFITLQAFSLALTGPLAYSVARTLRCSRGTATAWAGALLVCPCLGQLNLNYTYGWHPVSLALPLLLASLWLVLRGHSWWALVCALVACSFKENVILIVGLFCLACAFGAWKTRRFPAARPLTTCLPAHVWLVAAFGFLASLVIITRLAGFSEYQLARFGSLGHTPLEIAASPVLRPGAFWAAVCQERNAYFLACLCIPFGISHLIRGWFLLLPAALPLIVLLAWDHLPATSIAFQYTTTLLPLFWLSAVAGASSADFGTDSGADTPSGTLREGTTRPNHEVAARRSTKENRAALVRTSDRRGPAALGALSTAFVASTFLGAVPWSMETIPSVIEQTYVSEREKRPARSERLVGSPGHRMLEHIVARTQRRDLRVLATGRLAAHLLGCARIETVGQVLQPERWSRLKQRAKGRNPLTQFDVIILDRLEQFQQSADETREVFARAMAAGFERVDQSNDIDVLRRNVSVLPWSGKYVSPARQGHADGRKVSMASQVNGSPDVESRIDQRNGHHATRRAGVVNDHQDQHDGPGHGADQEERAPTGSPVGIDESDRYHRQ